MSACPHTDNPDKCTCQELAERSAEDDNRVFRIWYWDPCNGIGGRSKDCGTFKHREDAEAFVNERVGEPGSLKRLDENNWDRDAYRVEVIELK